MTNPYPIDGVQSYHDPWYNFHDGFLEFNAWSVKKALEKQKNLVLLKAFKGSDINVAWFPSPCDVMRRMEDWSGWDKEMFAENGFVEILRVARILKSHIVLTPKEPATLVALKKVMRRNASASSRSWRGEYGIDFSTWMQYFRTGEGKDSPYVRAAFLTAWLSKFVFGGFLNHKIMAECIPLAIRLAESVKLPLAYLMLGTLYHMLDLLHFDDILGANYYIIESHVCLSLLQMFAWERFRPYNYGRVTSGKALKKYPMMKCGYTSGTAPLACSWIGKRKIKGQVILEVDGLLDDYGSFNFHAYKTMPRTFAPPEVNLSDKALPTVPGSQIVEFTIGNSSHLETLAMIAPSMLPCITWKDNGQCVSVYPPILGMAEEKYNQAGAVGEELGQEAAGSVRVGDWISAEECFMFPCLSRDIAKGADEAAPLKRLFLGKRKSAAHPPKSKARRTFASPTSNESDESSWGNLNPEVIERIKRLRPVHGGRHLVASNEGFGPIPIPGDDKVPSKSKEAKRAEALHDLATFTTESANKANASEVLPQKPTMTKGGVKVSYGTPSVTKKLEIVKTQPKVTILKPCPISELPPFRASDFELVPVGFIPVRKTGAAIDEKGPLVAARAWWCDARWATTTRTTL
ncbi:hypothetical protein SLEP1_g26094 [Rubroshorea leprosula]|uniref:Aminotransferase-like plant mobile domain-containing protein n=1 Tax=Rubroshorea leprosula TaxID=152421 RepID=A0AAV5JS34_9ROSI|nr:hypothetical protein SLEP1_g26094 [Rubroshorea leprosula]